MYSSSRSHIPTEGINVTLIWTFIDLFETLFEFLLFLDPSLKKPPHILTMAAAYNTFINLLFYRYFLAINRLTG